MRLRSLTPQTVGRIPESVSLEAACRVSAWAVLWPFFPLCRPTVMKPSSGGHEIVNGWRQNGVHGERNPDPHLSRRRPRGLVAGGALCFSTKDGVPRLWADRSWRISPSRRLRRAPCRHPFHRVAAVEPESRRGRFRAHSARLSLSPLDKKGKATEGRLRPSRPALKEALRFARFFASY